MGLINKVKDMGIKFTYYVGGRAFDPCKQKRTTAIEDIIKRRKDEGELEGNTGVGKEDNGNI